MKTAAQRDHDYIPERFVREIVLHVAKNCMPVNGARFSLMLGIHGPSGEGKTHQCEEVLKQMGVRTFLISGGQLESPDAGAPAQLIRKTYLEAGSWVLNSTATDRAAVLLLNDVDTGLGEWGPLNQTTVNRQTSFGELMHLADYPEQVENRQTARIPIVLTGNDLTKLYEPLTRSGRMTSFEWRPTAEERIQVVKRLFADNPGLDCDALVKRFPTKPIAFFAELRSTLADDAIWRSLRTRSLSEIVSFVRRNAFAPSAIADLRDILEVAQKLEASSQLRDHLQKENRWP